MAEGVAVIGVLRGSNMCFERLLRGSQGFQGGRGRGSNRCLAWQCKPCC